MQTFYTHSRRVFAPTVPKLYYYIRKKGNALRQACTFVPKEEGGKIKLEPAREPNVNPTLPQVTAASRDLSKDACRESFPITLQSGRIRKRIRIGSKTAARE